MEKIPPFPRPTTDQTIFGFFPNIFADIGQTIGGIGVWAFGDHVDGSETQFGAVAAVSVRSAFFGIGLIIVMGAAYALLRPPLARAVETVAPIATQAAMLGA